MQDQMASRRDHYDGSLSVENLTSTMPLCLRRLQMKQDNFLIQLFWRS
jgi:hypothetical protein